MWDFNFIEISFPIVSYNEKKLFGIGPPVGKRENYLIEFTIFQEFSVRLATKMSILTKWLLWSRKLYLLFPTRQDL